MANIIIDYETHVTHVEIHMLPQNSQHTTSLTKIQCAVLLSMGFFNLLPEYMDSRKYTKPFNFNDIKSQYPQKIKALFNYFIRFQQIQNTDSSHLQLEVKFRRNQASPTIIQEILNDQTQIQPHTYRIYDDYKNIEDHSEVPQAVFANKNIGGGVLGWGTIQEEIRYLICPECIIVVLLCINQPMLDNESISIEGAERFSNYQGYSKTFQILDPFIDQTPKHRDVNMLNIHIIAFDAYNYGTHGDDRRQSAKQYEYQDIEREIIKLSSVFKTIRDSKSDKLFATGKWGCGGFNGNDLLNFVCSG